MRCRLCLCLLNWNFWRFPSIAFPPLHKKLTVILVEPQYYPPDWLKSIASANESLPDNPISASDFSSTNE